MVEVDNIISTVAENGAYTSAVFQCASIYDYTLTMGYDRQKRYNNVMGCIIASLRQSHLKTHMNFHSYDSLPGNSHFLRRVQQMLRMLAKKCTYERSGDVYIHTLLRSKLQAFRQTLLCTKEPPYDAISAQYGSSANELVRPYIDMDPEMKSQHVEWDNTLDLDGFQFVVGVLREALDGCKCTILCNAEIVNGLSLDVPYFFVISEFMDLGIGTVFGYGIREHLYIAPKENPHLNTIFAFISSALHHTVPSISDFRQACVDPSLLAASSPFFSISESLVQLNDT
jgi:hypothetical protein